MKKRLFKIVITFTLVVLPWLIALQWPNTVTAFFRPLSRTISRMLAFMFSPLPFAVYEWIVGIVIVIIILLLIRLIIRLVRDKGRKHLLKRAFKRLLTVVLILTFAFTWLWGLNYVAPPMSEIMDLPVQPQDEAFLRQVTLHLVERANEIAPRVPRDANNITLFRSVRNSNAPVLQGFETLAEEHSVFNNASPGAKRLTFHGIFSAFGVAGMYFPFTGEGGVNPDSPATSIPFITAHEIGHRLGFAREDEANFTAFLATRASDDAMTQYSGYFAAMMYCMNALYTINGETIWDYLHPYVLADIFANQRHYIRHSGFMRQVGEAINHGYLQAMGQSEGVDSYGMVVDLILAYFYKNGM